MLLQRQLPPPLMVSEPGSFAEHTIVRRKPQIIADVIAYNAYPPDIVSALRALAQELASERVRPPTRQRAEDPAEFEMWYRAWQPWEGATWREMVWYVAEALFYRRLMEAVRYFEPGPWRCWDPFAAQKRAALREGLQTLRCPAVQDGVEDGHVQTFTLSLQHSLWGNRADLSNTLVNGSLERPLGRERLLIDHTARVWSLLREGGVQRLDWVCDNAGPELLADLCFIDLCLQQLGMVQVVYLHLKAWPFYVSDAMIHDLQVAIAALRGAESAAQRALGERLTEAGRRGRLIAQAHPFWTSPLFFSQFPADLADTLGQADLIIFKGDANYRRLIEDRHWPATTPLEEITAYLPRPFLAMRTLKSEVIVGLAEGQAEAIARQDPHWLVNGERGVIHLCTRRAI